MNLTINIQTAHRVILGHEEVRPRIDCAHDIVEAEIAEDRVDPHPEGHHRLCPWPYPTPNGTPPQPDPPCICDVIYAATLELEKQLKDVRTELDLRNVEFERFGQFVNVESARLRRAASAVLNAPTTSVEVRLVNRAALDALAEELGE